MGVNEYINKCNISLTKNINSMNNLVYLNQNSRFDDIEINYSDSINIYSFLKNFNEEYQYFIEDYKNLSKLNFSKSYRFFSYSDQKFKIILDNPNEKIVQENSLAMLTLYELDGKLNSKINNSRYVLNPDYKEQDADMSEEDIRKYLDFGNRYSSFISNYWQIERIFGGSFLGTILWLKLDGKLEDKIKSLSMVFGYGTADFEVVFNTGKELEVNKINRIKKDYSSFTDEEILEIAKNLWLHKDYLFNFDLEVKEDNYAKVKKI